MRLLSFLLILKSIIHLDDGVCDVPEKVSYYNPKMCHEKKELLNKLQSNLIGEHEKIKLIKQNNHLFNDSYINVYSDLWYSSPKKNTC